MRYLNTSPISILNLVLYPNLHWAGNNIHDQADSIQYVINLQFIPTTSPLISKWIITIYEKKNI